ncbi:MAG TPA: SH3 domain-containing protein [Pseudomonas xinjiangensis]|uniref:SH3 domain-containing protein n=2 Tax=root TaxID=1 RepID=A0A7V1BRK6_9GAMM|nr:SH3 domain-containing protein [Halopseudomonas xinjiangensis]HEC46066.1 SH3 domain-containing protein [Halopseudomonas xinjiangensis]
MPISHHLSAPLSRSCCVSVRPQVLGAWLLGSLLTAFGPVYAQESDSQESDSTARWVSDSLNTYVRSGPTDGYRIVGTLTSGERVELVSTQGDYSRVRSESGDTVWVPSSDLQQVPGQAERLPQLEQQVAELSEQLETIDQSWESRVQGMQETLNSRKALVEELEANRQALHAELVEAQSELRTAQARLGDENQEVLMRYMVYGGGIAGAGLLVGLILPSMTRSRKRNDGWV